MGGLGSGYRLGDKKDRVEDCYNLSTDNFARWKVLKWGIRVGVLTWSRGDRQTGSLKYQTDIYETGNSMTFFSDLNGMLRYDIRVNLSHYKPGYGGRRYLFLCPRCGRRMRTLFITGGVIGCRICLDLTYYSCVRNSSMKSLYKFLAAGTGYAWEDVREALEYDKRMQRKRPPGRPRKQAVF
ncbi:MAG: hypothetical protein KBA28_11215 [Syntrophaceae bacterium]|jgi:hypothetical protein|nr:hypothetical protein [Syntrophaceae bacterium]